MKRLRITPAVPGCALAPAKLKLGPIEYRDADGKVKR
jgi:hypothetical protein